MSSPTTHASVQIPASVNAPITADFTEHALRVAYVARDDVQKLGEAEWSVPGVYVLLADDGSRQVYVGQSTALRGRLLTHRRGNAQVPGWERAIALKRDTTHGFTSADIGYLEGRLSAELNAVPGVALVKGKVDVDTTLPPSATVPLNALVPSILAAIRLAGVGVRSPNEAAASAAPSVTRTAVRGSVADLIGEGLLKPGAELYCSRREREGRGTVAPDGKIIVNGVGYDKPSLAAAMSLGSTSSAGHGGWEMWRVGAQTGPSLASLRRQLPDVTSE